MTITLEDISLGIASGFGCVFLIGCAWNNRRKGFRKVRAVDSPLAEAIQWLAVMKSSLEPCEDFRPVSTQQSTFVDVGTQLASLNTSLKRYEEYAVPDGEITLAQSSSAASKPTEQPMVRV